MAPIINKYLEAAMLPAAVLIIVSLITVLPEPLFSAISLDIWIRILVLIIFYAVAAWTGYRSVNKWGMGIKGGALTSAIAGATQSFVMVFVGAITGGYPPDVSSNVLALAFVAVVLGMVNALICGIFGTIGAFIASRKTKPESVSPTTSENT
ncbi:MAG: hypothetical protein ABH983_00490 [Candidatus Micrarchaeota archaeon]|nr:hypothetical protein [Candidatus Micrarchaeota archaeon]MBU1682252.1 hypothetical protein [Candidatus Micrarchaeota archaeon]